MELKFVLIFQWSKGLSPSELETLLGLWEK